MKKLIILLIIIIIIEAAAAAIFCDFPRINSTHAGRVRVSKSAESIELRFRYLALKAAIRARDYWETYAYGVSE